MRLREVVLLLSLVATDAFEIIFGQSGGIAHSPGINVDQKRVFPETEQIPGIAAFAAPLSVPFYASGRPAASILPPNTFNLHQKVVHLDLKQSPPKIDYFYQLFPYLKQLGATGLLLEYDRMFPYSGMLQSVRGSKSYTEEDIKTLLRLAAENKLEIIPLIHTFGHMKFLLGEKEFFDLREVISLPDFICPSAQRTQEVLQNMIDQVMSLHEGIKLIHIGSDQVFHLGTCTRCKRRKRESKMNDHHLFLDHVKTVAHYIREKHNLNVLVWDDALQTIPRETLLEMNIPNFVTPMLWKFDKGVADNMIFWKNYLSIFPKVWVASAFKGLTDTTKQVQRDMKLHMDSHKKWVDLLKAFSDKIHFSGIVLTGWQNYNHFSGLSNLLAVSLPSLTLDILFVNNGGLLSERLFDEVTKALKCNQPLSLDWKIGKGGAHCEFPGSDIFSAVENYESLKSKLEETEGKSRDFLKVELAKVEETVERAFKNVFFNDTLEEWENLFLDPIKTMLDMPDSEYLSSKQKQ